jgi:hypothetical protein
VQARSETELPILPVPSSILRKVLPAAHVVPSVLNGGEEAILSSSELVSGRHIHPCWLWDHRLSGRALIRTSSIDIGHRALCSEPQLCLTLVSALLSHVVVHVVHNASAAHNGRFVAPVNWVPR